MIEKIHEIFPYCNIGVITNGVLLLSSGDQLFEIMKKNHVFLAITRYEPTENKINEIKAKLDHYGITYEVSGHISHFRLQYNTHGKNDPMDNHQRCLDWCCHTIRGKKIGGCYYYVTADISNEVLGTRIPGNDNCFDYTTDEYTGAQLLQLLVSPTRLCAYCNSFPSPMRKWHQVTSEVTLDDWFYDE